MNVIFLGIDGVLATLRELLTNKVKFQKNNLWAEQINVNYPFDYGCVTILNQIIDVTDAEMIITSEWKEKHSLNEIKIAFQKNGIIKSPIDITSTHVNDDITLNRFNEINEYIQNNEVKNWVAIDTLNINKYMPSHTDRIFITEVYNGLKQNQLKERVISRLTIN
jgi:hypothetical protein